MNTSDSSSNEESIPKTRKGKKPSKFGKKQMHNVPVKGTGKPNRSKITKTPGKRQKKNGEIGLDGEYWNTMQSVRDTNGLISNYQQFNGDSTSTEDTRSTVSQSSSSSDDDNLLYENKNFITCRNPSNEFYLCQVLQDVYTTTKKIRIRWCSVIGEDGDDTKININTRFKLTYTDTLDPNTILTSIANVIHHNDTIALKKQDIVETRRLLQKSILAESLSSDDMMDLSTEDQPSTKKILKHIHFDSMDDNDSTSASELSTIVSPSSKKRKIGLDTKKSRKQPAKKRLRKTTNTTPKRRQRQTKDVSELSDTENDTKQSKKKKKPVRVRKTPLFKEQSNRLLNENLAITVYHKEPFFEDNLTVPFISSFIQSKLAIRAAIQNDMKLLKSLINDVNHVCSVHVTRSLFNRLSSIHYAIKNENIQMLQILLDDFKSPKKNRCSFPTVSMTTQSTGRANIHTIGFRTAQLMASRGAKEGNNALNKDEMEPLEISGIKLISYALKNNCSREIYDLLFKAFQDESRHIYDNIDKIITSGHRKIAASIIDDIKDNAFYGFNQLHHQVLLYDNEDIKINRTTSIVKKTQRNSMITPIHCAAINPNAKYLKQLLSTMPEYNILDKYERRPIHFAAACEGSEPLEYLLSKHISFNDVDRGGNSPLHIAVTNGRATNAKLLLRTAKENAGSNDADDQTINEKFGFASINRMNKSRLYPLHLAVLNNHLNCVKILLEYDAYVDVLSSASERVTPLMLACQKGYSDIVRYLIEKGAKIEARDRFKRTSLIHACMCGNADIVSYLLRLGADANVFDSSLNTALHYAIAYGWYFCVRSLLEAGANLNCVNSWQTTCLAAGFLKGHYGLCDYLLTNHNANINFKTDDGLTLVMLTVGLEISSSVVEQLEYVVNKHQADGTTIDANGNNAFHYLAENTSEQNTRHRNDEEKKVLRDNYFKMAKILLDNNCNPNQMNNKSQSPLMFALQADNFILVDYLIDQAKVNINSDISCDGKTLLHYFAKKCDKSNLIDILHKLSIDDEIKKMGQIFDNDGRTPLHYCAARFNQFCEKYKSSKETEKLKKRYQSIVQMIKYCLESAACDPDAEIQSTNEIAKSEDERIEDDDDDDEEENDESKEDDEDDDEFEEDDNEMKDETEEKIEDPQEIDTTMDDMNSDLKLKETTIFSLLRTIPFVDSTIQHPLEIFLQRTKNLNVLHYKTHRTPLLEAIHLQQSQTAEMLINHSKCDINLSTSIVCKQHQQTPLILACKLHLLSTIRCLLEHKQCNILSYDYEKNQAIHYYLQTSNRINEYLDILNLFIKRLKSEMKNSLNSQGKHQRTPLHIAVYHNLGTIDAITHIEKSLIDHGSDLFIKDDSGNIPLHNVFLNKNITDDPVELCVLLIKAMKSQSIDTTNNEGNTPLHLAVTKCSTVCVMLLQQHNASLLIENNLSNSILGTCIVSDHLNLFITFLQQTIDIDLGKLHTLSTKDLSSTDTNEISQGNNPKEKSSKIDTKDIWKWKYSDAQNSQEFKQYSLMYLIVERDWQGALSLILNDIDRFHLTYLQIIETAILNNKLNLVLRLLLRLNNEKNHFTKTNSSQQNLFHLLANMNKYNEKLLKQILLFLYEYNFNWNTMDTHGVYPLHYACVKQNFTFMDFLHEKYPTAFNLYQKDSLGNTANGLLFWLLPYKTTFAKKNIRLLITSGKQLDCLCTYNSDLTGDPLSFGYIRPIVEDVSYISVKTNNLRTSPLIHAVVHNNFQLVKFLLELDADINFSDENKQTPLMHAVRQNNVDIVKLLLNKNYSLGTDQVSNREVYSHGGKRPRKLGQRQFFLGATTIDADEISDTDQPISFEKTSSINLNAIDSNGRTCIHHLIQPFSNSSYRNNLELLRLLHSCGASLTITDHSGLTPLQTTLSQNYQHLYEELIKLTKKKSV